MVLYLLHFTCIMSRMFLQSRRKIISQPMIPRALARSCWFCWVSVLGGWPILRMLRSMVKYSPPESSFFSIETIFHHLALWVVKMIPITLFLCFLGFIAVHATAFNFTTVDWHVVLGQPFNISWQNASGPVSLTLSSLTDESTTFEWLTITCMTPGLLHLKH